MSDNQVARPASTGFPHVALPAAVKTITDVAKYGKRHARSAFAQYLGHESAQSGPFKTKLAAFRDWGLVTTAPEIVELTPLAVRLALPPDPEKVDDDLIQAFRNCRPFVEIYDACAKGQRLELETIANMAVHRVGIAAASKERFVTSFAQSVVAVGLGEQDGNGLKLLASQRAQGAVSSNTSATAAGEPPAADPSTVARGAAPKAADAVLSLSWPIVGGEVVFAIHRDRPLGSAAFSQVAAVTAAIEELAGELSPDDEPKREPETSNVGAAKEDGAVAA